MNGTPIETPDQAETLRTIRNACCATLHDPREITAAEQLAWWTSLDRSRWSGRLFADEQGIIGAGCWSLREADPKKSAWWITVMVVPERRREGLGTAIYRAMIDNRPEHVVFARIRRTNIPSLRAAFRAGWRNTFGELWQYP